MKFSLVTSAFLCLTCLLSMNPAADAQGVGASGNITGTVTDPSGAVIPNASIVAVETARGTRYATTTDETGQYRLNGLLPANYDITAQIAAFGTELQKEVVVNVGATVVLDFHLKVATTAQVTEVTAAPPVVETERAAKRIR